MYGWPKMVAIFCNTPVVQTAIWNLSFWSRVTIVILTLVVLVHNHILLVLEAIILGQLCGSMRITIDILLLDSIFCNIFVFATLVIIFVKITNFIIIVIIITVILATLIFACLLFCCCSLFCSLLVFFHYWWCSRWYTGTLLLIFRYFYNIGWASPLFRICETRLLWMIIRWLTLLMASWRNNFSFFRNFRLSFA